MIKNKALVIDFNDLSFFESGSTKLTPQGVASITKIAKALEPFKDSVHITVQGHTDSAGVRSQHSQYGDNWELSVIRATAVLKSLLKSGYPQEVLSAEGFADTQATKNCGTSRTRSKSHLQN